FWPCSLSPLFDGSEDRNVTEYAHTSDFSPLSYGAAADPPRYQPPTPISFFPKPVKDEFVEKTMTHYPSICGKCQLLKDSD
ncbi:MAG: hypothetical protein JXR40_03390, partial [Pontiellaceae bacterium]|nr:hypothetical protein [Pontiellaceae bacterium]